MSPRSRSILGKVGGIAATILAVVGILAAAGQPAARALGIATEHRARAIVSDSIKAHRADDVLLWRKHEAAQDSLAAQIQAIRCNVDRPYRVRHADECEWRVTQ